MNGMARGRAAKSSLGVHRSSSSLSVTNSTQRVTWYARVDEPLPPVAHRRRGHPTRRVGGRVRLCCWSRVACSPRSADRSGRLELPASEQNLAHISGIRRALVRPARQGGHASSSGSSHHRPIPYRVIIIFPPVTNLADRSLRSRPKMGDHPVTRRTACRRKPSTRPSPVPPCDVTPRSGPGCHVWCRRNGRLHRRPCLSTSQASITCGDRPPAPGGARNCRKARLAPNLSPARGN